MKDHEILAVLLQSREVCEQHLGSAFSGESANWIWRKVQKHVTKYDELPDEFALCTYIELEVNQTLQATLPSYLAKIQAVNVTKFRIEQLKAALELERQGKDLDRLIAAREQGDYAEVLADIASYKGVTATVPPIRLSELEEVPDPDKTTEWLGWKGESTLLDGGAKAGKSTVGASDCAAMLTKGETVLWISADEPLNTIVRRFRKLRTIPGDPDVYIMHRKLDISWDNIHAWAEELKPDVIYCDAFHSLTARLEGKIPQAFEIEECRKIADKFTQLAERYECAVIVFIHQTKNGSGGAAGSVQIQAAFDMLATIKQAKGSTTKPVISFVGRFEADTVNLEYHGWEDGCTRIEPGATPNPITEVLELINNSPSMTYDGIAKATKIQGWKLRKGIIPELRKNGWITENGGKGQQSKIFEVSEAGRAMLKQSSSTNGNQATSENPHRT